MIGRGFATLFAVVLVCRTSAAEPCVEVSAHGAQSELGPLVAAQLRASLESRKIGVCDPSSTTSTEPIAKVVLEPQAEARVVISVEVSDAITNKRVSRDVDLSAVPRDAWPLTLALATDEVLRASWAELALKNAPPPARPVPPE